MGDKMEIIDVLIDKTIEEKIRWEFCKETRSGTAKIESLEITISQQNPNSYSLTICENNLEIHYSAATFLKQTKFNEYEQLYYLAMDTASQPKILEILEKL